MTFRFIKIFLALSLFAVIVSAQTEDKYKRAETIYNNLEYNTLAFDDLKPVWNVVDPGLVREIFNKAIVKDALKINSKEVSKETLSGKINEVYEGDIFLELRKRYYDDEIESIRFFEEKVVTEDSVRKNYFFDPITDHLYIKSVLGDKLYNNLQNKFYGHTDLTKTQFYSRIGYNFDIYFHLFEPEVMFYNLSTGGKSQYLFSFLGNWGNEYMVLPGWYAPDYFLGVKMKYLDAPVYNKPFASYFLELGAGFPVHQPDLGFMDDGFGQRLYRTGMNFRVKAGGRPFRFISPAMENLEISVTAVFTISEFETEDYVVDYISNFDAIRNYGVASLKFDHIVSLGPIGALKGGLGGGMHDHVNYLLDPGLEKLTVLEPSKFQYFGFAELGFGDFGGLLNYDVGTQFNYHPELDYGYFGVKTKFLISNFLGFEFQYFKSLKFSDELFPFYRRDNYFVFSPIIRINY